MAKKAKNKVKKVTRIYTISDGELHFEDIEVTSKELGDGVRQSKPLKVKSLIFKETDGDHESGWHNAPRRQFVLSLECALEIELGDGTKSAVLVPVTFYWPKKL